MMDHVVASPQSEAPDLAGTEDARGDARASQSPTAVKTRRRGSLAWLALCATGSATVASLMLVFELRQALPLGFVATLLLAALTGYGLPALISLATVRRLHAYSIGASQVWFMVCVLLAALISIGLSI